MPNRKGARPHTPPPKRRRKLFGGVIIFAIIAIAAAIIFFTPLLDLSNHNLYGNSVVSATDIWEASGFTARLERTSGLRPYPNFFSISASRMEEGILTIPYIYTAEVIKSFPRTITVRVTERVPTAYVICADMMFIYVDRHGIALEQRTYMAQLLPIITGLNFEPFTPGQYLEVANPASLTVALELANLLHKRDMLIYRINSSDIYNIRLYVDNMEVLFGAMTQAEEKLTRLYAILTYPYRERGIRGTLDLTDPSGNHVFIPLR